MARRDEIDLRENDGDHHEDHEDGRGGSATSPMSIPAAGWKDVLMRTKTEMKKDHVPILAAGVAFYLMLSLFPFAIAALSIYGLVADPQDVAQLVERFSAALPESMVALIEEQLTDVSQSSAGSLSLGLIISVLAAVWSASKGAKALIDSTNIAFDEEESRGFLRLRLLALAYTGAFLVVILAAVAAIAVLPALLDPFGRAGELTFMIIRWPLLAAIAMVGLGAAYRYAPDRDDAQWQWLTPGAVVATLLWLVGSALFALYASNFGSFNETYGSLSAVIVLLLWLDLTAFAILLGAEINAEAEHQTARDSTKGEREPLGERGAYVADTVGDRVGAEHYS